MADRIIKFRAFDKRDKCMTGTSDIWNSADWASWRENFIEGGDFILMQYTGLKDKNGKEIYESDLVKVIYQHDGINNYDYEVKGQIKWDEKRLQWCIESDKGDEVWTHPLCDFEREQIALDSLEVIGNIYPNPELLK